MNIRRYLQVGIKNPIAALWAFIYRMRRLFPLDYLFLQGYSFPPDFVTIVPTKKCNFKCYRCAAESFRAQTKNTRELTTKEFKIIVDKIASYKPSVYFSGGEPFLRNDIFDLMEYTKKKKMVVGIVTNGSMLNEYTANKLIDIKVDFLGVSLDGPEEYHDIIRVYKGAYKNLVSGLKLLIELKRKKKVQLPQTKITCIIDHQCLDNTYYVLKLANEIGVDQVDFGNMMFYPKDIAKKQKEFSARNDVGGYSIIGKELEENYIFNIDKKGLFEFYKTAKRLSKIPMSIYNIDMQIDDFYSLKMPSDKSVCKTPWFSAVIDSFGNLEPCQGYVVGNLLKEDFMNVWNNKKMRTFRRIRRRQVFPACFRCIEGQRIRFKP